MKDDGGPAFPPLGQPGHYNATGMTLRDYFAAMAMQGLIHDILIDQNCEDILMRNGLKADEFQSFLAKLAYKTADAMLAAKNT